MGYDPNEQASLNAVFSTKTPQMRFSKTPQTRLKKSKQD
jgi:hypothetical protein